jgi:hypothetical protein
MHNLIDVIKDRRSVVDLYDFRKMFPKGSIGLRKLAIEKNNIEIRLFEFIVRLYTYDV